MKPVKIKGIKFVVDNEGVLILMKNLWLRKDVTIPSVLPNGQQIKSIGTQFCRGKFGRITISDEIVNVQMGAFVQCDVDEVVWPSKCEFIPPICFIGSELKKLSNIDNVTRVDLCAFACSKIESIHWPKSCSVIPHCCFYAADIEEVNGLEDIVQIAPNAFLGAMKIKKLDLSANVICEIGKSAFGCIPRERVIFPYYSNADYEDAFKIPDNE